ncbi:MAG TPA: Hpt domain-containing protein [Albitalea sp.]
MEQITSFSSFVDAARWPLLDTEQAVAGLGGSVAAYREIARVFLDHLPAAVAALHADARPAELLPVVHELGSSLGTVGAMRAHRVARSIEARWRQGDVEGAAQCAAVLRAVVAASAEALTAAVGEPAGR